MSGLKFGRKEATHDERDLLFARYSEAVPPTPAVFGHQSRIRKNSWGMLGNDEWGDCAVAGPAHETMLLTRLSASVDDASFTTANVLKDYSTITGFDPNAGPPGQNDTDQGCNVRDVLAYRRKTGVADHAGKRHKIGAYVNVGLDPAHVFAAAYVFESCGLGIVVTETHMREFDAGQPWTPDPDGNVLGGHYVPLVGRDQSYAYVVTWGRLQPIVPTFLHTQLDEAWAYISREDLDGGESPEGFDLTKLREDLAAL